jgi:hypothetical protein
MILKLSNHGCIINSGKTEFNFMLTCRMSCVHACMFFFLFCLFCFRFCMNHWRASGMCLVNFWRSGLHGKKLFDIIFPYFSQYSFPFQQNLLPNFVIIYCFQITKWNSETQLDLRISPLCVFFTPLFRENIFFYLLHNLGLHFLLCLREYIIVNVLQSLAFFD